jgi:hypothetical protein
LQSDSVRRARGAAGSCVILHSFPRHATFFKEWTLPVAIVFGSACYFLFSHLPALDAFSAGASRFFDIFFPFCVFLTLFTTFAKVDSMPCALAGGISGSSSRSC